MGYVRVHMTNIRLRVVYVLIVQRVFTCGPRQYMPYFARSSGVARSQLNKQFLVRTWQVVCAFGYLPHPPPPPPKKKRLVFTLISRRTRNTKYTKNHEELLPKNAASCPFFCFPCLPCPLFSLLPRVRQAALPSPIPFPSPPFPPPHLYIPQGTSGNPRPQIRLGLPQRHTGAPHRSTHNVQLITKNGAVPPVMARSHLSPDARLG